MDRQWLVNRTNPEFIQYLSKEASVSPILAQVLVNRGIKDAESAKKFLSPLLEYLHDPFLLNDMEQAVQRVANAVNHNETVLVHGDYDADGVTSAAILVYSLRMMGLKVLYHIPNRITEGYGVSMKGVEKAADNGAGLIITADCGITSHEQIDAASARGIDVIVTDHHQPSESLPDAVAVIDPHRKDSIYPFQYLAGVGVAFKLVQALCRTLKDRCQHLRTEELLDLVALGTIADSVPLVDENRIFVTYGLKQLNSDTCRTGIRELKDSAALDRAFRSELLSYTLIPRINAAGRLHDAGEVVELFLTEDRAKAKGIAGLLNEQNRKRKGIETTVFNSALKMIEAEEPEHAIVLHSPEWHPGVIGIVASRLVDMFHKPVFLFSVTDSVAKGSSRGIPSFHLFNAIKECSHMLLGYGGHKQAAGLKIEVAQLPAFKERINSIAEKYLSDEAGRPTLEIDAAVRLRDINFTLIKEISLMEPFGESNREPVFGAKDIHILNHRVVGNNHLKMQLRQERTHMDTIGFSMGKSMERIGPDEALDIAFVPAVNEWNGMRNLQLNLKAIRPGAQ